MYREGIINVCNTTVHTLNEIFSSSKFFSTSRAVPKIVSIFNITILETLTVRVRVTSKLRDFTLIQVARSCSKVFQRFSASLVQVGVVQGVPR